MACIHAYYVPGIEGKTYRPRVAITASGGLAKSFPPDRFKVFIRGVAAVKDIWVHVGVRVHVPSGVNKGDRV